MSLIPGWFPPSRQRWELLVYGFQFFPTITVAQWIIDWYPQGKTSVNSRFNLPGKWAWFLMESPGFLSLLYCMWTIPQQQGIKSLPWVNWTMAGLYSTHYFYRAWLSPLLLNPSMSPIHLFVFLGASVFNITNGLSFGGWLGGYGPTTLRDWAGQDYRIEIGLLIWGWGLLGNIFHDEELRNIRRNAMRRQQAQAEKEKKPLDGVQKLYMLPENGLFKYILYPHYLCEWIEWAGFWLIGGWSCVPARTFLINEVTTMLPRALQGKTWYIERFGRDKVGNRRAVIPGLL